MLTMLVANFAMVSLLDVAKKLAMMDGNVSKDWAKMIGIMPAMLTIRGSVPLTGMDIRTPIRRPGYMTGTFRRPCWTTTMANMVPAVILTMMVREGIKF